MKHTINKIAIVALMAIILNSCAADLDQPHTNAWHSISPDECFDFATTVEIPLDIQFDGRTLVYIINPNDELGNTKGPQQLFSAFTDDSGKFSGSMEIPSVLLGKNLLAVADGYRCRAKASASGIKFVAHYDEEVNSRSPKSRAESVMPDQAQTAQWSREVEALYKYRYPETRNNLDRLEDRNNVCLYVLHDDTELMFSFVHNGGRFMSRIFYFYFPEDLDVRDNPDLNNVDKLYDFFVTQQADPTRYLLTKNFGCIYTGTSQYGSSPSGNGWVSDTPLTGDISEIPEEVRGLNLVSTKTENDLKRDYYGGGFINRNFNNNIGARCPILFYGPNYEWEEGTAFPAGYRVGFLLDVIEIPNGSWNPRKGDARTNPAHRMLFCTHKMLNRSVKYYSSKEYNGSAEFVDDDVRYNQVGRAVKALEMQSDGTIDTSIVNVIYGFEDALNGGNSGCDEDFNDMVFMITSTPKVSTANIPVVGEGAGINGGTLLFEDLYPNAGDYDMNDVIVEYEFVKTFDIDNKMTSLKYRFWPMHYGATYDDDFWVSASVSDPKLIFTADQMRQWSVENIAAVGRKEELPRYVEGELDVNGKGLTSFGFNRSEHFNPFIYVHNTRREVHMVDDPFVGVEDATIDDITDPNLRRYSPMRSEMDGTYFPFAMNIPLRYTDGSLSRFRPVRESVRIENEYNRFLTWMASNGSQYSEWYMYYSGGLEW